PRLRAPGVPGWLRAPAPLGGSHPLSPRAPLRVRHRLRQHAGGGRTERLCGPSRAHPGPSEPCRVAGAATRPVPARRRAGRERRRAPAADQGLRAPRRVRVRRPRLGRRLRYGRLLHYAAPGTSQAALRDALREGRVTGVSATLGAVPPLLREPSALFTTGRKTSAVAGHLLTLWLAAALVVPRLHARRRRRVAAAFAQRTLRALGVSLRVRRERPRCDGPRLLVANHISWLDVYAVNAVEEARFVAKSETRTWPLLGAITAAFDSLFIIRGSCRDAARVKDAAAAALRHGDTIVVFPEGTTTDGTVLRRFYPALFQAAIDAGAAVQPVAIRYPNDDG